MKVRCPAPVSQMKSEVKKKGSASSLLSLIRPANSVLVGFAVIVGIAVTSKNYHEIFTLTSLLGFLTGFFISSFSMVSNDIYDLEVDRVNQPTRPIPSSKVTVGQAKIFSVGSSGLGACRLGRSGICYLWHCSAFCINWLVLQLSGKKIRTFWKFSSGSFARHTIHFRMDTALGSYTDKFGLSSRAYFVSRWYGKGDSQGCCGCGGR